MLARSQAKRIPRSTLREGRRTIARALRPHWHAEHAFVRALRAILGGVHEAIVELVDREVLPAASTRQDADESVPDRARRTLTPRLSNKIAKHVRSKASGAYDVMAGEVDKKSRASMKLLGLPVSEGAANAGGTVAAMREGAVRLVEDAGRSYADDVRDIFMDPANEGLRVEELRGLLLDRGSVSLSRASLLARDQTLKLSASLNEARFASAGVSSYVWSGSLDERERPAHFALEGQVFSFDDPPVTSDDGATNNPGQDYQCRCVPLPVLPDLDPSDDDALDVDETDEGGGIGLGALLAALGLLALRRKGKPTESEDLDPDDDEEDDDD